VVALGRLRAVCSRHQPAALTLASLGMVGLFAACHGHAHASEATGLAPAYLAGFLLSTAMLHLAGIGLARRVAAQPLTQRALGTGIALSGLWLMAG
jgi:urease accessory protein